MEQQIRAILSGLPGVKVKSEGALWCVSVGSLSGAREDGVSLARDLRRQYEYIRDRERAAEAAPIATSPAAPVTDYEAIIADLKAQLAAKPAFEPHAEPAPVEIPEFLQSVPGGLTDLARENEPHGETKARLWKIYVDLQSRIADNGKSMDLPTTDQYALHSRLSRHLDWIRGTGAVDVI